MTQGTEFIPGLPQVAKTCSKCREAKPEAAFHSHGPGKKRMAMCGDCRAEHRRINGREGRKETAEERLGRRLWECYKITLQQYRAMVKAQSGACAICGKTPDEGKRLAVDHCHTTGVVRALLCIRCNLNLGVYENHHRAAAEYLATYGAGNPLLCPAE
ncbi:endonuclease domain-containing protein [Streptomyces sp. NPDC057963]|uniref:endonuclease domain-containing protein n=1 Tax=Streptomyces sp. NPDC057963 TaxID=3346290 RepID=UPI0036E2A5A4